MPNQTIDYRRSIRLLGRAVSSLSVVALIALVSCASSSYGPIRRPEAFESALRDSVLSTSESVLHYRKAEYGDTAGVLVLSSDRILFVVWDEYAKGYSKHIAIPYSEVSLEAGAPPRRSFAFFTYDSATKNTIGMDLIVTSSPYTHESVQFYVRTKSGAVHRFDLQGMYSALWGLGMMRGVLKVLMGPNG